MLLGDRDEPPKGTIQATAVESGGAISMIIVRSSRIAVRDSADAASITLTSSSWLEPRDSGHRSRIAAGAERQADRGQVLNRSVMKIAGDPPALRLGAVDRPLEERRTIVAGTLQATCERQLSGTLHDEQKDEARDRAGKIPLQIRCFVGMDDAVELIGLEEELGPVGGAYRQIDLHQGANARSKRFSGRAEVTDLGLRLTAGERCLLAIASAKVSPIRAGASE